jgi:hypothetical protein
MSSSSGALSADPEFQRDSFDKNEPKEKNSGYAFLLAIRKKSHKIYRNQDLAFGVFVEIDTIFLSW